jgi:hypothetical protein
MNIQSIRVSDWDKDGTIVKVSNVTFDDGSEAPGYDLPAGLEEGKPLPEGWELATAKSGKKYIKPPKKGGGFGGGGGFAAHRNTKEGQEYEQERMDRRTALMQATALVSILPKDNELGTWGSVAGEMYAWLRQTAGGGHQGDAVRPSPAKSSWSAALGEGTADQGTTSTPAGGVSPAGEKPGTDLLGAAGGGGPHVHDFRSIPNVTKYVKCECGETQKKVQS